MKMFKLFDLETLTTEEVAHVLEQLDQVVASDAILENRLKLYSLLSSSGLLEKEESNVVDNPLFSKIYKQDTETLERVVVSLIDNEELTRLEGCLLLTPFVSSELLRERKLSDLVEKVASQNPYYSLFVSKETPDKEINSPSEVSKEVIEETPDKQRKSIADLIYGDSISTDEEDYSLSTQESDDDSSDEYKDFETNIYSKDGFFGGSADATDFDSYSRDSTDEE